METVESEKHCAAFEKAAAKLNSNNKLKVLIQVSWIYPLKDGLIHFQVNTSREEQKGGASPEEAVVLGLYVRRECHHLELNGFMTIGSVENSDKVFHALPLLVHYFPCRYPILISMFLLMSGRNSQKL